MTLRRIVKCLCLAIIACSAVQGAFSQDSDAQRQVMWIALSAPIQFKKLTPGTVWEGKLTRDVYWRREQIFSRGSTVRLVVDRVERRKKAYAVDDRPFFIHLFAPRHQWTASFRSAEVEVPRGGEVPLRATFEELAQRAELEPPPAKAPGKSRPKPPKTVPPWVLTVRAEPAHTTFAALAARRGVNQPAPMPCAEPCTVADGTRMSLVLTEGLSASRNRQGQTFRATLLAPVMSGSTVAIPQGSIVEGVLAKRVPPRRMYRPGSLFLMFNHVALPNGAAATIAASPVEAQVDRGTHMTMDAEGRIHAQNPGTARFLLDFGITGGISKVSDDTTQLIIESIVSTATDASTAGVARWAAMGADAIYLLTRHGRDVILPPYTEMDVSLSRAVAVPHDASSAAPPR